MPFKSGKQRRYLWANEPEIAREWTDRYGAAGGGIMHQFENYAHGDGNNVSVPRSFQARPNSDQVNLAYITPEEQGILQSLKPGTPHRGPMEIPNYDSFDAAGNYSSGAAMSAAETGGKTERDRADMRAAGMSPQQAQDLRSAAINAGAGQTVNRGWFGPKYNQTVGVGDITAAKAFRNDPNNRFAKQAYRNTRGSPFGIGNLLSGAMGMFGSWPGKIGSMLSHIDPRQLRGWNEQYGRYNTQKEYEDARTKRQLRNRIDRLRKTRDTGMYANDPEGWAASDLSGRLEGFEKDVFGKDYVDYGRNRLQARDLKALKDQQALTSQLSTPKRSLGEIVMGTRTKSPVNLDPGWSAHRNMTHANAPQSIKDFYTNSFKSRYDDQGLASLNDPWAGPKFQQVKVTDAQRSMIDNAVRNYNLADSDFKNNPTLQQDVFDEAKKQDDKGSTGFWGMGKRDPEPMTRQEYKDYLVSKGYV